MTIKTFSAIAAAAILVASCGGEKKTSEPKGNGGIDIVNFDTTVRPGDDFFKYVNGNWVKNNPIPSTEKAWGSFSILDETTHKNLRSILDEAAADKNLQKGTNKQKIGDFYATAMDSVKLNKDGASPLKDELDRIASLKSTSDLVNEIAHLQTMGLAPSFAWVVEQDMKKSDEMLANVYQAGMTLPDKDYYFRKDPEGQKILEAFQGHVQKMFERLGERTGQAADDAKTVLDFETRLASKALNAVEQRDIEKLYHKMSAEEIQKSYPNIGWSDYFKTIDVSPELVKSMNIAMPDYLKNVNDMLKSVPLDNWKTYLRWQLVHESADYLSDDLVNENFNFYGKTLNGIPALKPRWKRALATVDGLMGEALGQVYVEKYFSAESKRRVNEMVDNLMKAYRERIATRTWMNDSTKKHAYEKLDLVMRKLAYPDKWRDYSALDITRDSYVMNVLHASQFGFNRNKNKLGKPVDRTEWGMSPPTINAYYNPAMNEIVFPAGIMQPPFFNPDADDAVNYGGMGAVIGHELTHGFDDQGCLFDAKGNMKNWWTAEDKKNFDSKKQMVVKQFDSFTAIDTCHVKGQLTLGENIADLGGLTIAYHAYLKSLEGKDKPGRILGFTPEQRVFIGWAQVWRVHYREEALKFMLNTNPHSPGMFRVNGPVSNMKAFYEAWGLKQGDKLWKPDSERAEIW